MRDKKVILTIVLLVVIILIVFIFPRDSKAPITIKELNIVVEDKLTPQAGLLESVEA